MERLQINPWTNIWVRPRETMRAILNWNPVRVILWLALIGGAIAALTWLGYGWAHKPEKRILFNGFYISAVIVTGAILGLVHLYLMGWLYQVTGRWIGGKGNFTDVKCAVGWTNYPYIVSSILALISLLAFRNMWIRGIFAVLNWGVALWAFIIFINLLGEAHRFSTWKGLLAFIIAFLLVFIVAFLIALLIPLLMPLFSTNL